MLTGISRCDDALTHQPMGPPKRQTEYRRPKHSKLIGSFPKANDLSLKIDQNSSHQRLPQK